MVTTMARHIWWMPVLMAVAVLAACSPSVPADCGQEAPRLDVIPTLDPAADAAFLRLVTYWGDNSLPPEYGGVESLEEVILQSDVIARVEYLSKRPSVQQGQAAWDASLKPWFPVLEFRFRVHEYLKGSGPNEIGGLLFHWVSETETGARTTAGQMSDAHDPRWDCREAIVFLQTEHVAGGSWYLRGDSASGQHWLGPMVGSSIWGGLQEGYTVASIHRKAWLPEAGSGGASGARAGSASEKLFLLDVPSGGPGGSGARSAPSLSTSTAPPISLIALKSRIVTLEAEASASGTPEYRDCVLKSHQMLRAFGYEKEQYGYPRFREDYAISSGLPAGRVLQEFAQVLGWTPNRVTTWRFGGLERDIVRYEALNFRPRPVNPKHVFYTRRLVTTRPIPAGTYVFYPNGTFPEMLVCNKDLSSIDNRKVVYLTVTAISARTLHEAFFDPVSIGDAVGADASNGYLKPAAFSLNGATTTITSLKWENGAVTMALSPSASLTGYVLDFIDTTGTTILSLSSANTTALTWSVPDQPWHDGDLLMLRLTRPPPE